MAQFILVTRNLLDPPNNPHGPGPLLLCKDHTFSGYLAHIHAAFLFIDPPARSGIHGLDLEKPVGEADIQRHGRLI